MAPPVVSPGQGISIFHRVLLHFQGCSRVVYYLHYIIVADLNFLLRQVYTVYTSDVTCAIFRRLCLGRINVESIVVGMRLLTMLSRALDGSTMLFQLI